MRQERRRAGRIDAPARDGSGRSGLAAGVLGALVGPVAGPVRDHLVAGVDQAVREGLGDDGVEEERIPVAGRPVAGDDHGPALPLGDEFVEVVGLRGAILFTDWDRQITACVARLRAIAGTAPDAPDLTNLVGELLLKSPDFAGLWERYEVTGRKPAHKTFHHPHIGTVTLTSQPLHVEGTPGQRIGVYTAEPGTPDHDALLLLDMTAARPPQRPAPTTKATGQQP